MEVGAKEWAQVLELVEVGVIKIKRLDGKERIQPLKVAVGTQERIQPLKVAVGTQELTQALVVVGVGETVLNHLVLLEGLSGEAQILLIKMAAGREKTLAIGTKETAQVLEVVEIGGITRNHLVILEGPSGQAQLLLIKRVASKEGVHKGAVGTKELAQALEEVEVGGIMGNLLVLLEDPAGLCQLLPIKRVIGKDRVRKLEVGTKGLA